MTNSRELIKKILFVTVFVAGVAGLFVYLRGYTHKTIDRNCYTIEVFFKNVGGIKKGAPVMLEGVPIGEVKSLSLDYTRRGVITVLAIQNEAKIPVDSKIRVSELGMLGESYLGLSLGQDEKFFLAGDKLDGESIDNWKDVFQSVSKTAQTLGQDMSRLSKSINTIVADPEFSDGLKNSISEMPKLIKTTREFLETNKENARETLGTMTSLGKKAEGLISDMHEIMEEMQKNGFSENLSGSAGHIASITAKLDEKSGDILSLVKEMRDAVAMVSSMGNEVKPLLKEMTDSFSVLNHSGGSAGLLLKDPKLYGNLNSMAESAAGLFKVLEEKPSSIIWGKGKGSKAKKILPESQAEKLPPQAVKDQPVHYKELLKEQPKAPTRRDMDR